MKHRKKNRNSEFNDPLDFSGEKKKKTRAHKNPVTIIIGASGCLTFDIIIVHHLKKCCNDAPMRIIYANLREKEKKTRKIRRRDTND